MGSFAGRGFAEVDFGLVDLEVGRQPLALNDVAVRRQVAGVREPEAAAVGQAHELLDARTAERALADQVRALVPVERGSEELRRTRRAGRDQRSRA